MMQKFFKIIICFFAVDFYFFSSRYTFTGPLNTKEILAVIGLVLIAFDWLRNGHPFVTKELIGLLIGSGLVSFMALFTSTYHNTFDTVYYTFFLSMLTWLSGAYAAVRCIYWVHGRTSIETMCKYIVYAALAQGLVAVLADNYEPLDIFVNKIVPGMGWMKTVDRLYGFAETATLDTGGIRFAIASVLCMYLVKFSIDKGRMKAVPWYILVFGVICVTGNMVARTTIVGTGIGLVYLLYSLLPKGVFVSKTNVKAFGYLVIEIVMVYMLASALYKTNDNFYNRTRFAFEGFFSLAETGHWHTGSNDVLIDMYVWPDNLKTWLIGDGRFLNPEGDLNYYGRAFSGYYMNSDVGYVRFIYFFGLIGLLFYVGFIVYAGFVCIRKFPHNKLMMLIMMSMTFVIWFKVATDCFFILCMFICLGYTRDFVAIKNEEESNLITD